LRKKKAFAFFPIEILSSFFPLFFFVPQKSAALPSIFMSGLRLIGYGGFVILLCGGKTDERGEANCSRNYATGTSKEK
uniref:hypothetical protein n=1 Tax=Aneurinibacillus sp. UBA3580 TaxID=1946041 RepID=UPI00257BD1B5